VTSPKTLRFVSDADCEPPDEGNGPVSPILTPAPNAETLNGLAWPLKLVAALAFVAPAVAAATSTARNRMNLDDDLIATTFLNQKGWPGWPRDQSRIGASFGLALAAVSERCLDEVDTRRAPNLRSTRGLMWNCVLVGMAQTKQVVRVGRRA
jgi:hypothetical protein